MGKRRRFTIKFKRQAVQLLKAGRRPRLLWNSASAAISSINGRTRWRSMVGPSPEQAVKPRLPDFAGTLPGSPRNRTY